MPTNSDNRANKARLTRLLRQTYMPAKQDFHAC